MLTLYNSLARGIEPFEPRKRGRVKMFTCGPSIYQRPHIGNYRTFLFEDILQRYLEYLEYAVERTLNFTDVEDKSIQEATKLNMDVLELAERNSMVFFRELVMLRIKPPDHNPRSSTSVEQAVSLIEELLKKGYAYWYRGNVYFDPLKFEGFGKLSRVDKSRWPQGKKRFHRDTYPGNRWNLGDFILWHGYRKGDTIFWDSPIGKGRPAWNVQDPAMAVQTLGFEIDIFCGGIDNMVRHHDYVIAVTESVSGKPLSRYWLHGAHLLVEGKKMSKSKGNIIYPDELQKAGHTPEEIRFFLMYRHYRKRLNFTYDKLKKTSAKLKLALGAVESLQGAAGTGTGDAGVRELTGRLRKDFERNMDNDLDVRLAFDDMLEVLLKLKRLADSGKVSPQDASDAVGELRKMDYVFQLLFTDNTAPHAVT
ncbi:MAG TPA: class I tRNA ligase family protein [Candidatus Methanoperedenaceae archaeon]|nr:class I tRNA ligase family protein [Candidatus Methanoperedenaceae archaeon]